MYKSFLSDAEFLMRLTNRISAIDWETAEEYYQLIERLKQIARNMSDGT